MPCAGEQKEETPWYYLLWPSLLIDVHRKPYQHSHDLIKIHTGSQPQHLPRVPAVFSE